MIVTVYPWNELDSLGSPFVSTFAKVGITAAAGLLTLLLLQPQCLGVTVEFIVLDVCFIR